MDTEKLKLANDILDKLLALGFSMPLIIVAVVIIIIIIYGDNLEKLKRLVASPFYHFKRWFARSYISRSISLPVSRFINSEILAYSDYPELKKIKVKVNFFGNANEIKKKKNTLIVRLREDDDQTKNILFAANILIPTVICPLVRPNIDTNLSKAIDLTVLKKLAERLGRHGRFVFQTRFLDPEILNDPSVSQHVTELTRLDRKGLFTSIFANELHYLGEDTFSRSDRSNRTADVVQFIQFLIEIAEREIGEINVLDFHSQSIKTGIILLARVDKAEKQGLAPYLSRLRMKFNNGSESVYIIAFTPAWSFFKGFVKSVKDDLRYRVLKVYQVNPSTAETDDRIKVALIKPNFEFSDRAFKEKLEELEIGVGSTISGVVTDVSRDRAVVNCNGINCFISKSECSWYTTLACSNELDLDQRYTFQVKEINESHETIELTLRLAADDPWIHAAIPAVGDQLDVTVHVPYDLHFVCRTDDGLEVKVPMSEAVWGELLPEDKLRIIGQKVPAKVVLVQGDQKLIRASFRALHPNPWNEIKARFPAGTRVMGIVVSKTPQFVTIQLAEGIFGRIPKESFIRAGNEYHDFEQNLLIGARLEVRVLKVFTSKEKISLELERNFALRALPRAADLPEPEPHKIVKMETKRRK